ncbi:MAG: hypothetical protein RJB38_2076 [Pseudomonadota bacterium]|jgi:hypothetical protein
MSYITSVKLKDYQERDIELSDDSWEHIRESHPEITLEDIRLVLADPLEVRECPRQSFVELFYQTKAHPEGKPRFRVVVVKVLTNGLFISTAMTTVAMKEGRTLYRKGEVL